MSDSSKEVTKVVLSTPGNQLAPVLKKENPKEIKSLKKKEVNVKSDEINEMRQKVYRQLSTCKTQREALEMEVNSLSECVALAIEIFNDNPVSDNSVQVTSLVNAHRSALNQLEKMKDPELILMDIESHIRSMFTAIVKALAYEIDKTKNDFMGRYPQDKVTIEDLFVRMNNSIQPETQNIYGDMRGALKKVLGIRG